MGMAERKGGAYSLSGVNYAAMDPVKILAQKRARETSYSADHLGIKEVEASRGESAYVWEEEDRFGVKAVEGLGTKNVVADEVRKITGKTYYDLVGYDTVSTIVNDVISTGAQVYVITAFWAAGSDKPYLDQEQMDDLTFGWALGCKAAGAIWGQGETQTLKGIVYSDRLVLGGDAVGYIKPKELYACEEKIKPGDAILLVESSGIHTNGLTLCREIAQDLPKGYATKLYNGSMFGEALLTPSFIYSPLVRDLQNAGIDIHYMSHITGHGWAKLMRPKREFRYVINKLLKPMPLFDFIQTQKKLSDFEMYKTFNMGAGFAIIVPKYQARRACLIASFSSFYRYRVVEAGYVEKREKEVLIKPKGLSYKKEDLNIR